MKSYLAECGSHGLIVLYVAGPGETLAEASLFSTQSVELSSANASRRSAASIRAQFSGTRHLPSSAAAFSLQQRRASSSHSIACTKRRSTTLDCLDDIIFICWSDDASCSLLGVDGHAPEERHYPSDESPTTGDIKRCYSFAIAMLATESDYCRQLRPRRSQTI